MRSTATWSLLSLGIIAAISTSAHAFQQPEGRVEFVPLGTAWVAGHGRQPTSHPAAPPAAFTERHGDAWSARRFGPTGSFIHLIGEGIEVDPRAVTSARVASDVARRFWREHPELLPDGVSPDDLVEWTNETLRGARVVSHRQTVGGVPVLRGSVFLIIDQGRITWIGSRCLPVHAAATLPGRTADQARATAEAAMADLGVAATSGDPELVLFPLVGDDTLAVQLAYAVPLRAVEGPGSWTGYVDASEDTMVAIRDELVYLTAEVQFEHHDRHPGNGFVATPAAHMDIVTSDGGDVTDGQGQFTASGSSTSLQLATEGPYANIDNEAGTDLTWSAGTVGDGDLVLWAEDQSAEYAVAQMDAFAYANQVHDFAAGYNPSLPLMGTEIRIYVNYDSTCNAASGGDEMWFFRAGDGCNNTAMIGDVIWHEWGHSYHMYSTYYGAGGWDDAVSEGFADSMAFLQTGGSVIAPYFMTNGSGIRDVAPNRVYPDDIVGESHTDGLIVGGSIWDMLEIMEDEYGEEAGRELATEIYMIMPSVASDIPSTYEAAIFADDDNGNLADGSPHVCEIDAAFGQHGLVSGGASGALAIEHEPVVRTDADETPIPVTARVDAAHPECAEGSVGDVRLVWSLDGGESWDSAPMTETGDHEYGGELPGVPWGTQIRYRIEADDLETGTVASRPFNEADPGYYLYVGGLTEILCVDFDEGEGEWTHALLEGEAGEGADDWMLDVPKGTGGDPDGCYTGDRCWGNDLVPASNWNGLYQADKTNTLISPVWDLSDHESVRLQFRRWLQVEDGYYDQARIYVNDEIAWENGVSDGADHDVHHTDNEWILFDLDISAWAAGEPEVQIRWEIDSDGGLEFGGWTIDDLCLYTMDDPAPTGDDDDDDDDDAASGGDDDGGAGDGGGLEIDGGCACRQAAGAPTWTASWVLAAALVVLAIRRRRG